ncbi:hypothetical protein PHAVU_007G087800 [Phaseolus vulgaris]|uniref:Uncharacterized protein n=1 Tax=Phaseolus vulgaris TaxID=3885 RepID=V7BCM9_PHAVU|nr:hypothetical protein PHAVU_007G087800g [Phaseolus vulgaris]ESW15622.1 hypothetical protein PHAVU_007G087800g [Phaseolus vulgaris]
MNAFSSQHAIILAWLLCTLMLNTGTCNNFTIGCNQKDKLGLLNFKQRVIDLSGVLSSWNPDQDCCQWRGVNCDHITGRVTRLNLPCSTTLPTYIDKPDKSHCLSGSIHLFLLLVELEFLNYLNLSNNDFLALQFDSIHQNCHNLSVVSHFHRCVNSSFLGYLNLSFNDNLAINKLMMSDCQLKDLSPSLQYANFTSLNALDLSNNEFSSELPKWLFNLSSCIFFLEFGRNSLRGKLPEALLNLQQLEFLNFEFNDLDGPIPYWFGKFQYLKYLIIGGNMFSGSIPPNLGNLSSLIALSVSSNQFTGTVSERNFAKLSKLKALIIFSSPPLIFDCDSHWVPPFQLERLFLRFVGPNLPKWLYTQRYLERLSISDSSFVAQSKFWNFVSRVSEFDLSHNLIVGNLSHNVLLNSSFVSLSSNSLKGSLPRLSSNVTIFDVSNNSLSGTIFPLLCNHKMLNGKGSLIYLDISRNHLSGELTNCWKNWKSLTHVNLGSNSLTGKIPSSMGSLVSLASLHLHDNNLYGTIPTSLQNCHSLLIFNVRENNLSGNIPHWIPHDARALQLRSNNFNGNIPTQICQISSLIILDIADNIISGHIPTCLHNITYLVFNNASESSLSLSFPFSGSVTYFYHDSLELITKGRVFEYGKNLHFMTLIDMSNNNLFGTVPPQMFNLIGLCSLNLSHNKLMGKLPYEIGNMRSLESFDLSANQFWGEIPQSLANLFFLEVLNLSFNNFSGKVPSGTQLQGFDAVNYIGNPDLCGPPLPKICWQDGEHKDSKLIDEDEDKDEFLSWFYIGIESGFVTGFLGVSCALFFNRKWRHVYFKFLYNMRDRLYVMVLIKINSSG